MPLILYKLIAESRGLLFCDWISCTLDGLVINLPMLGDLLFDATFLLGDGPYI